MFRSLTEALRSLWSPSSHELEIDRVPTGSKRKSNASDRSDENGKRRKLDDHSSTITGYIRNSVTKMASWIRPKSKPFAQEFATRPLYRAEHSGRTSSSQENGSHRNTNHFPRMNGEGSQNHVADFSSSSYKCSETSIKGPNVQKRKVADHSSFTSESSMLGHRKQSIANESLRLHEREQYRQLLQLQSQRSPWQVKIPMNTPREISSSAPSSSYVHENYFRPPDSNYGSLRSRLDAVEVQKSGMSSLLRKQRSRLGLPESPSSPVTSPKQAIVSHVKPQPVQQQHLRTTQVNNTSLSRTSRYRGGSLSKRYQVTKDDRNGDPFPHGDTVGNYGDMHKAGLKMNGDVNWDEDDTPLEEPQTIVIEDDDDETPEQRVPPLKTSQSELQDRLSSGSSKFQARYKKCQAYLQEKDRRRNEIEEEEMKAKAYEEKRRLQTLQLERQMRYQMKIFDELPEVTEDIFVEPEEEEEEEQLPELTDEMMDVVRAALRAGNPDDVLSDAFRLQITRRDMSTLAGLNWLNDEVINFYMNMLTERGERDGQAKVYAFNTFFYPKIMSGGHAAVKRWTKKVDIFSVHFILIPVHLGMHWCLCVVDMDKKIITYYDSMGATNNKCLQAVLNYINDESIAKKQTPIKKSEWTLENATDNPQQMNGSDCGMFMCKYAEYITRQREITFTQEDMPYFRQRMVYEIISKKLLQ